MKPMDVRRLLETNGFQFHTAVVPNRAEFYRKKGFQSGTDTTPFLLMTIPNPNHDQDIHIMFDGDSDTSEFYDLEFGGYWYEMFGCLEETLPQMLLEEIRSIVAGRSWVIFASDAKTGRWRFDALFCDSPEEEWNDMAQFRKVVAKIKARKSLWRKLTGRTDIYEIFNWQNYERIVK